LSRKIWKKNLEENLEYGRKESGEIVLYIV